MRCRMARTLVSEGDEARLSAAVGAELRAHLAGCADCARLQRESALTRQWLQELPIREPAPHFDWRLKLRLSQQTQELPVAVDPTPRRWLLPFTVSTAAAAALVLTLGLTLGHRGPSPSESTPPRVAMETSPGPWAPAGRPAVAWPRLVPVRASTPLGPELRLEAAASILGSVPADTLPDAKRQRSDPIETMPVRW
ncbi:MAG TPA: hypothetical protein VFE28_12350 [Candidatus Krumholzibacteria bacterium]|nr:hypothetical protein [Candidatus Krumholzibacteria bacterium]